MRVSRWFAVAACSVSASVGVLAPATSSAAAPPVAAYAATATLLGPHVVRSAPGGGAQFGRVAVLRPITDATTVLPVLGTSRDASGRSWLRVRLPGRVLHQVAPPPTGWILAAGTVRGSTSWHLVADLATRRMTVYRAGRVVQRFRMVVGAAATPTPTGSFFVEESVVMPAGAAGAPFALATSARSNVLQEFEGGPGQIAVHGLRNVGGTLGTAASHGCMRMSTPAVTWLSRRIAPGTPLTIS